MAFQRSGVLIELFAASCFSLLSLSQFLECRVRNVFISGQSRCVHNIPSWEQFANTLFVLYSVFRRGVYFVYCDDLRISNIHMPLVLTDTHCNIWISGWLTNKGQSQRNTYCLHRIFVCMLVKKHKTFWEYDFYGKFVSVWMYWRKILRILTYAMF